MSEDINLNKFCGEKDATREHDYTRPFVRDGWKYATDGRVCIRVPSAMRNSRAGGKPFPNAAGIFIPPKSRRWVPWPRRRYCPQCFDTGELLIRSAADVCVKCVVCGGNSHANQVVWINGQPRAFIGSHLIDVRYDALLRTLPKLKFLAGVNNPETPLPFKFKGGEGRLMGCKGV